MFFRLFLAFLAFGVFTSAIVGVLILQRTNGVWTPSLLIEVLPIVVVAASLAIGPAWFFARNFVKPFAEIRAGAEGLAQGDYRQRIHGGVWRETRELAHSFNEMSERLAEQINRLDNERQHLRAILDGMAEGVVAVGQGQRVVFANDAAGLILEFDPKTAIGRPLYEVSRQPAVQLALEQAVRSGQANREEIEFKKPVPRFLSLYVAPLAEVETDSAILVMNDTSELRRLERLRQEFVANVSHELKTPLAVLKTCVEALMDGAIEEPEVRGPFLSQIAEAGDRLHALILDLLSLARIESGEELFTFEEIPVSEMVVACLDRHRPRAEAKRMPLEILAATGSLTVWADEEAVGQILDNLVDNAVKYTPEGGSIRVSWIDSGEGVCLSVADTGAGIPDRDLLRIFERFYRVDKARSRELGGTGLGLSIVKHLVQAMRGTVKATSQMGKGTTFSVWLPKGPAV